MKSSLVGNSATMVRIVPYAAITYMSNEHYKNYFKRISSDGKLSGLCRFASGSLAGLTASFSTYGLEVISVTRLHVFVSSSIRDASTQSSQK